MTECPLAVYEYTDFWSRLARDGKWHTTRAVADRQNLLRLPQNVGGIVSMLKTLTCSARLRKPRLGHAIEILNIGLEFSCGFAEFFLRPLLCAGDRQNENGGQGKDAQDAHQPPIALGQASWGSGGCGIRRHHPGPRPLLDQLEVLATSDIYWDEVISVEEFESPNEWVYDLCVALGALLWLADARLVADESVDAERVEVFVYRHGAAPEASSSQR